MGCSGSGTCVINCIVHHADGTSEAGAFTFPDWFGGATTNQILTANGGVSVTDLTSFDSVNSGNPKVYAENVELTNTTSAVTSVDLSFSAGGNGTILGVSGATSASAGFSPITMSSGYNEDMIVENTAANGVNPVEQAVQAAYNSGARSVTITPGTIRCRIPL